MQVSQFEQDARFWKNTAFQLTIQCEKQLRTYRELCEAVIRRLDAYEKGGDKAELVELDSFVKSQRDLCDVTLGKLKQNEVVS